MFVVASGNPFDGLMFHGPFEDSELAEMWATTECPTENWWIVELEPVNEIPPYGGEDRRR